jgi:hypothetical protein
MHPPGAGAATMRSSDMKQWLLVLGAIVWLAGTLPAQAAPENGRYQVSSGTQSTVMIDTRTGRAWVLTPAQYGPGQPKPQHRYQWEPIGFLPSGSLTPPEPKHKR